jgi:acyl-CoA dehydrogenase
MNELAQLVDDLGRRSLGARIGRRGFPDSFDEALWLNLEDTGLARLTSSQDAGPAECAIVLSGLARHAAAVPIAETDLLAAWLAGKVGLPVPDSGPLTVAIADAAEQDGRISGTAPEVPWPFDTVVLAARTTDALHVALIADPQIGDGHNLAGEPRGSFTFDIAVADTRAVDVGVADELTRRGAWARCNQIVGMLDAAGDYGFDHPATDYAVTAAKVAVGRAVGPVTTTTHQLHGAIGVTIEHWLWLATMRARSWVDEFGTTTQHARRLGRMALAFDPWDVVVSYPAPR